MTVNRASISRTAITTNGANKGTKTSIMTTSTMIREVPKRAMGKTAMGTFRTLLSIDRY